MHISWNYITDSSLKMPYIGIFVKHALCLLYWNQKRFCKPEQREDNSKNLPMGRMSLAISWRSDSFQLKTVANKKSKNTSRVEINQICDAYRDFMRSYYAIDKICGVELPHPLLEK